MPQDPPLQRAEGTTSSQIEAGTQRVVWLVSCTGPLTAGAMHGECHDAIRL